jgi:hypothetical protein
VSEGLEVRRTEPLYASGVTAAAGDWMTPISVAGVLLWLALAYVVLLRFGILALAVAWLFYYGLELAPVTPDFRSGTPGAQY